MTGSGLIFSVVQAVVLAMSVGLLCWCARSVIDLGREMSTLNEKAKSEAERMRRLEDSIIALSVVPGKIEAMTAELGALKESLTRFEKLIGLINCVHSDK